MLPSVTKSSIHVCSPMSTNSQSTKAVHSYLSTDVSMAGSAVSCLGRRLVLMLTTLSHFPGTLMRCPILLHQKHYFAVEPSCLVNCHLCVTLPAIFGQVVGAGALEENDSSVNIMSLLSSIITAQVWVGIWSKVSVYSGQSPESLSDLLWQSETNVQAIHWLGSSSPTRRAKNSSTISSGWSHRVVNCSKVLNRSAVYPEIRACLICSASDLFFSQLPLHSESPSS